MILTNSIAFFYTFGLTSIVTLQGIVKHLEKYLDSREFNAELVRELVERISISNTDGIEITFKCADVYANVLEIIEGGDSE